MLTKKLVPSSLALILTLTGCGSGGASPASGQAASHTGSGCPMLNGKYEMALNDATNTVIGVQFDTKLEDGKYSYSTNGGTKYFVADGVEKTLTDEKGQSGNVQVSCSPETLNMKASMKDKSLNVTYTMLSETEIRIAGGGEHDGVYTKVKKD
jgi:hypothetical protein